MNGSWWAEDVAGARTEAERTFLSVLPGVELGLDVWFHEDPDGLRWLVVSRDFVVGSAVRATLRVDFDLRSLRGGWSPACLNWDNGVRAVDAGIDLAPPDGIVADSSDPSQLAALATAWFARHIDTWRSAPTV